MAIKTLLVVLASILVGGCATTSTKSDSPPETPPTMYVIEGRPEAPSMVDQLQESQKEVARERIRAADFEMENEKLRAERDSLQQQLAEQNGQLLDLRARVDTLARDAREATDALLSSEIEKAVLQRRLLEIRLADLRKPDEEGTR